jgi:hypothetical protein
MDGVGTLPETVMAADVVEVAAADPGPAIPSAKKTAARQMPRWEADARDRLRVAVRRFARPLADLTARGANEGDTRLLVTDFIDELWRVKAATSATSIGAVITSTPVIDQIRKELRRQTGHNVDPAELSDLIRSSVLRPDALCRPRRPTTVVCGIPVGRMEDLAG